MRSFRDSFLPSFSQSSSDPSLRWTPPWRSSSSAPASDDRFWDGLRTRIDTILEDHRLITSAASTSTCLLKLSGLVPGTQDYNQQRPSQELVAKDLHDTEWKFRHIYRG
ncbi:hypothetical protein ZWY2020_013635 [Hordeum vulgare]|nr:hypothetical protein ZWY2020_013635 [Hordeum vulgare]